jgi:hypothetical protein
VVWKLLPIAAALLVAGCAPVWVPLPVAEGAEDQAALLNEAETLVFRQHIHVFYQRLVQRRFNTLETFNDPILRDTFRSIDLFFDYYADFAQALAAADVEKSRPGTAVVLNFTFDSASRARVLVRFSGKDGRPMRFGTVYLDRVDRWERADNRWWVTPERL